LPFQYEKERKRENTKEQESWGQEWGMGEVMDYNILLGDENTYVNDIIL
jgi:hypothetical protein